MPPPGAKKPRFESRANRWRQFTDQELTVLIRVLATTPNTDPVLVDLKAELGRAVENEVVR